jgi:hemerythrin-like domain-containing protein
VGDFLTDAIRIVSDVMLKHELFDDIGVFSQVRPFLANDQDLVAMERTHDEIRRLSRRLQDVADAMQRGTVDRESIEDAQRVIETLVTLCRIHKSQEDDIYETAAFE